MAHTVLFTLAGLVCSALWLSLLVASDFSSAAVGVGLLGMLILMSDRHGTHR